MKFLLQKKINYTSRTISRPLPFGELYGRCRFHGGVTILLKHGKRTRKAERLRKKKMRVRREVGKVNSIIESIL
jgi:hypothetical protein